MKKIFSIIRSSFEILAIAAIAFYISLLPFPARSYDKITSTSAARTSVSLTEDEITQAANYPSIDCQNPQSNPFISQMLGLVNQERAQNGKPSLAWSPTLCQSAGLKSQDMIANSYFDHVSPSGVSPWHWFKLVGYKYTAVGENLALNYYTAQSANTAFMNSPGHRENILNDNFTQIGIAYIYGQVDNQDAFIVVEHFGKPAL